MFKVSATDEMIYVRDTETGTTKGVRFLGTRMAGDLGRKRTTRQVAIRWAEITGTSEECASAAWCRLGLGRLPAPSKISERGWEDILESLDAEISALVNDPDSKFYIYG